MKVSMGDFGLLPNSDFSIHENAVRLSQYWIQLKLESMDHYRRFGEMIPFKTITQRLQFEFSLDVESLYRIADEGAEFDDSDSLEADDEISEEEIEEIVADLAAFVAEKLKQRLEEEMLFRSLMNEN